MVRMKNLILSSAIVLSLSGCFSGIGPSGLARNGCYDNCSAKDFYQPGKGVWADDSTVDKSTIGAGLGTVLGVIVTHSSGDPLIISAAAVAGMFLGHEVGATFDKIDQMYFFGLSTDIVRNFLKCFDCLFSFLWTSRTIFEIKLTF